MSLFEVMLFVDRLIKDWDRQPAKMKKSWSFKEAAQLHATCGAFLHYMLLLENKLSEEEFKRETPLLYDQFFGSFLDPDLLHAVQTTVPPGNVADITMMRPVFKLRK